MAVIFCKKKGKKLGLANNSLKSHLERENESAFQKKETSHTAASATVRETTRVRWDPKSISNFESGDPIFH